MNKVKLNNKGMTLIELLIVLAIMGLVLQLVYSIFFVGNKSFTISKNKGFVQQDARLVADIITKEIRTSKDIGIDNLDDENYSLSVENGTLIRKTFDGTDYVSKKDLFNGSITKLNFINEENINGIIRVSITTKEGNQELTLEFDILLENITNSNNETINSNTIYYTKYD